MKIVDRHHVELNSGKSFTAYAGILGLGEDLELREGYDGHVDEDEADPPHEFAAYVRPRFTSAERREIAEYMIALWTRWAEKPEVKAKEGE